MKVTLFRVKEDEYGTHGYMVDEDNNILCRTIERRWHDNQHDISCIPDGTYPCVPHIKSNNGQHCWLLNNVPGRTGVLIHTGNTENDSEGCIIVGRDPTPEGVSHSMEALDHLHFVLPDNFDLAVISQLG